MPATEAQKRAISNYEKNTVDRINCRLPKGLKQRITATGKTVNAFIIEAIEEKLSRDARQDPGPAKDPDAKQDLV